MIVYTYYAYMEVIMELRTLRYFLAVCREGNMSRAAEALHLTQPTLSRQIADLEHELGCELLVRGRSLELTNEGVLLRRRAEEIVQLADQAESELRAAEKIEGTVRIAAGESWGISVLARVMRQMRQRHPHVTFAIHSGNREDVSWRLDRGLADFAVFIANSHVGEYDHIRLSPTDAFGLLMPEDHPLAAKEMIAPHDLLGIPLIMSEGTLDEGPLASWCGQHRDSYDIAGTYSLAYNAAVLVKERVGCAVVLDKIIPAGQDTGLEFKLLYPPVVAHIDLAWKRHAPLAPAAEEFKRMLMQG